MNAISVDIKDMIVAAGLAVFGTDIFIGKEPTSPDDCVTLYDYGGREQDPFNAIDEGQLQCRARTKGYIDGYNRLFGIKVLLEGREAVTVNSTDYRGIWTMSNIAFMKYDKENRAVWVVNFRVIRQPDNANIGNRLL